MTDDYGDDVQPDDVGQALRAAQDAIDKLVILANKEETRWRVCEEKRELGYILTRAELLCSFALAVRPAPTLVRRISING